MTLTLTDNEAEVLRAALRMYVATLDATIATVRGSLSLDDATTAPLLAQVDAAISLSFRVTP